MLVNGRFKNIVFKNIFGQLFNFNLFIKIFLDSSLILTYLYKGLYKIIRRIQNTIKEDALTLLMTQVKANISIRWIKPLTRDETEQQSRFTIQNESCLIWLWID